MNRLADDAADFANRRAREGRRQFARRPKRIADVVAQLIARKGYGRIEAGEALSEAWSGAVGKQLSDLSRVGKLRRGALEVWVANSAVLQEITFQKKQLLAELNRRMPDGRVRDLRLRIGPVK